MGKILLIFWLAFPGLLFFKPFFSLAQISAPGSDHREETNYPVFSEKDPVFIFCSEENQVEAGLRATTTMGGLKNWKWEKYNSQSGDFEFYSEISGSNQSEITGLDDGCYRVTITSGSSEEIYRAWVFNNWNTAGAMIPESNCDFFTLKGTVGQAQLVYYDLETHVPIDLYKDLEVEWRKGEDIITRVVTSNIYDPPAQNTDYTLVVTDRFGCEVSADVTYHSIVTKASFTVDPASGEAPLEVKFTNTSENGDAGRFEWFFFRDLDDIKRESAKTTMPIDSIMVIALDDNPVYVYENSGTYMVKLVSKKKSDLHLCTDTFYLEDYIVADTSFIDVPNVFTPNGDGTNDNFVVKFWSVKEIKISVFNRWGRTVHVWQSGNVRGFNKTWVETVWDGRIGDRPASPGVYFYVVEGFGRDGKKRWKHGNVYLFRGKE